MAEFTTRQPRAPVFGRRAMVVSGHSAASLAGIARAPARRQPHRCDDRRIGGAGRGARPCHLDRRRLLHPLSRGARPAAPSASTPRASRLPPPRPTAFPDGMKVRGPLAPGGAGAGARLGGDASPLRQARLARVVRGRDRPRRERPSRVAGPGQSPARRPRAAARPMPAAPRRIFPTAGRSRSAICSASRRLARTLKGIAADGADSFYLGATAHGIGAYFAARGGLMRAADLAAYRAALGRAGGRALSRPPVTVMPPNSYGILLPMQLNGAVGGRGRRRWPAIRCAASATR